MKEKIILILIILAILGGVFYWYEWRPTQIRKGCAQWNNYEPMYEECLHKEGLEK